MAVTFTYNFPEIQKCLNNIDEKTTPETVKCELKKTSSYTTDDVGRLTDEANNIVSVPDRMKLYDDILNANLQTFSTAFDRFHNTLIELKNCPSDIQFHDGEMELTGFHKEGWPSTRNCMLTTFFKNSINNVCKPQSFQSTNYSMRTSDYLQFFDNLENFESTTYDNYFVAKKSGTINSEIYSSDIVLELQQFMDQLQKIKLIYIKFQLLRNNLSSAAIATYKKTSDIDDDSAEARRKTKLFIGPYSLITQPGDVQLLSEAKSDKIYDQSTQTISFSHLVKVHGNMTPIATTIPNSVQHSNGVFSYTATIQSNEYDLRKNIDVETEFDLKAGSIISRKNILKAIDYIFYVWLTNIQTIVYSCLICHSNCHSNTLKLDTLENLKVNGCCYCGTC